MRYYIAKPYGYARRWHVSTNLDNRADRETIGVWYVVLQTPWFVLDVCGPVNQE